jgi:hypothetical protein
MGRLWRSFSAGGLLLGTLFFAAALTPTLLPRNFATQGVLSGLSLAAGYGIGVFGHWLGTYMDLPPSKHRLLRIAKLAAAIGCTVVAVVFLWRSAQWQNSIRELMQLVPVDSAYPLEVGLIALAVFAILMAFAYLFRLTSVSWRHGLTACCPGGYPTSSASSRRSHYFGRSPVEFSFGFPCLSWIHPFRPMMSLSNRRLSSQQTLLKPAAALDCWLGKSLDVGDGSSSHWGRLART